MATWLALDLSLSSTGFALWSIGSELPVIGHWKLADSMAWRGRGYARLHRNLVDLHNISSIDHVVYEETLSQNSIKGGTTVETIQTLGGLAAHVESFAAAVGATCRSVNMSSWRRHFIGSMPRGTKKPDLKAMAMARSRELGLDPFCHDEAEAFGILDHHLSISGVIAPWRAANVLTRDLTPRGDGRSAHHAD
jgi:hypothetical protein